MSTRSGKVFGESKINSLRDDRFKLSFKLKFHVTRSLCEILFDFCPKLESKIFKWAI